MKLSDTNIFTKINRQLIGKEYKSSTESVFGIAQANTLLRVIIFRSNNMWAAFYIRLASIFQRRPDFPRNSGACHIYSNDSSGIQ